MLWHSRDGGTRTVGLALEGAPFVATGINPVDRRCGGDACLDPQGEQNPLAAIDVGSLPKRDGRAGGERENPMRLSRSISRALVLLACMFCAALGTAEAAGYRTVTHVRPGHVAWIYLHPDVASPHVGYLRADALHVRTSGCRTVVLGGWCRVMRRGTRGWVQDRFLKPETVMRG